MIWIKLHTTLHHHIAFRRLTAGARLVFYVALEIAGDVEQDGALSVRGAGPMTVTEIATEVGITEAHTLKGLEALIGIGFMSKRQDGAYVIEKWDEKTAPKPSTERVKAHRERKRSEPVSETLPQRVDTHARLSREEEVEVDTGPNGPRTAWRRPTLPSQLPERLPTDVSGLQAVATVFVGTFCGAKAPDAVATALEPYTNALASFRSRGVATEVAWGCFADARLARGGKPLFGAMAKTALSYLPAIEPGTRHLKVVGGGIVTPSRDQLR